MEAAGKEMRWGEYLALKTKQIAHAAPLSLGTRDQSTLQQVIQTDCLRPPHGHSINRNGEPAARKSLRAGAWQSLRLLCRRVVAFEAS